MEVPLLDLKAQYAGLRQAMIPALEAVMESQYFIHGPAVKELETEIAAYCETPFAVGLSSGTDALLASLMTLGIGRSPFDTGPAPEVITTPYTFFATAGAIWRVGARPVFVDIDPETYNIDAAQVEAAVTEGTRAIMPVHLYGQMADMDPILAAAKKRGLYVIEDGAQAIGSRQNGRKAGSLGTIGCFSFFPSKNLGGGGDGGIVTTRDADIAERLSQCRNHGSKPKYYHKWVGGNFRLDTLQAALIRVKLPHLERWHEARRRNAAFYDAAFADVEEVTRPVVRPYNQSIYNQYVIRVPRRDECIAHLKTCHVGCEIYYPVPMHLQECFKPLGYKKGDFPHSEQAAAETLAIPIYPELTEDQMRYVVDSIKAFLS